MMTKNIVSKNNLALDKKLPRFCHQAFVGKGWFFKDGSKKSLGGDEWSFGFHRGWLLVKGMSEKRSLGLAGLVESVVGSVVGSVVVVVGSVGFGW